MNRELIVRPEAEADLARAFTWYEGRLRGLGYDFLNNTDAAVRGIMRNPELYPIVHHGIRRALVRRFPYAIFYLLEGTRIVALAIFHASRDPAHWQRRAGVP